MKFKFKFEDIKFNKEDKKELRDCLMCENCGQAVISTEAKIETCINVERTMRCCKFPYYVWVA